MTEITLNKKTKQKSSSNSGAMQRFALLFTIPNMTLFVLFFLVPAVLGLAYSFTDYNGYADPNFVGIQNYIELFNDRDFINSFKQTVIFTLLTPISIYAVAIGISLLMSHKDVKGKGFLKAIIYVPTLLSPIIVGITWRFLFGENFGFINYMIGKMGFEAVKWSTYGPAAMFTIMLACIWCGVGGDMILILSRLSTIPEELYESAKLDGANSWQTFRNITLPMLKPTTFMIMLLGTINMFKEFAITQTISDGGPGSFTNFFVLYIYKTGFDQLKVGYASAASMVLFVFLICLSVIQMKISKGGAIE